MTLCLEVHSSLDFALIFVCGFLLRLGSCPYALMKYSWSYSCVVVEFVKKSIADLGFGLELYKREKALCVRVLCCNPN